MCARHNKGRAVARRECPKATDRAVTNSTVGANDVIILNQASGTNLYDLLVTAVAAGSFNVTFLTTGGVATDAPVINFAVIDGVAA